MEILRGIHWEMILVQDIELREDFMMSDDMVRFLEDLGYVTLVAAQMVRFLENLGKFHWEGYLVQILERRESPPVEFQMADMREDPLLVSQDIGIRSGGVSPGK